MEMSNSIRIQFDLVGDKSKMSSNVFSECAINSALTFPFVRTQTPRL